MDKLKVVYVKEREEGDLLFMVLLREMFKRTKKEEKDFTLVSAKDAWESTKEPQLKNVIAEINEARIRGNQKAYVSHDTKLHQETVDILLKEGYDLRTTTYDNSESIFNEVFWDENACGKFRGKSRF